jgi:hypothetical protein
VSRSGYCDDLEPLALGRWRNTIDIAARGRRGQKFFRDLVAALDAMPEKRLVAGKLQKEGEVCALGALGRARGVELEKLDTYDYDTLGETFDIAHQLAQEVMYENDERYCKTPEERWAAVRTWAAEQIVESNDRPPPLPLPPPPSPNPHPRRSLRARALAGG